MTDIYVRHGVTGRIRQVQATDLANLQAEHQAWEEISADEAHADARYIRTRGGTVHSLASVDLTEALAVDGVVEITEAEARAAHPELFGES